MNAITKRIVKELIADRESWEHSRKEGWKLRLSYCQKEYANAREAIFMDEIFFPRAIRLVNRLCKMSMFKDWVWEEMEVGFIGTEPCYWPADECNADWLSDHVYWSVDPIYSGEDWDYEELTEQAIWAEFEKPSFVQEQLKMFS